MADQELLNKKFQKEMNAGTASLVLLGVLQKSEEAMYGYQIAKLLEEYWEDTPLMKQGALYPVLRSLDKSGQLSSMVEPSISGPPRRYYQITEEGRKTFKTWSDIWQQTKTFIDAILEGERNE